MMVAVIFTAASVNRPIPKEGKYCGIGLW